jgi:hypothetical protein
MSDMMRNCMDWMMSFGWPGMLLAIVLFAALIVLAFLVIARQGGRSSR